MACQEATEAYPRKVEVSPEEIESEAEHEKVPKDAMVKPFGAMKKRHRDRHLAVGQCGEPKERTWGNCGSRRKLAATRRGMTRCVGVARRRGHGRKGYDQDSVVQETQKGRILGGDVSQNRNAAMA
jgi:hypothetical protein